MGWFTLFRYLPLPRNSKEHLVSQLRHNLGTPKPRNNSLSDIIRDFCQLIICPGNLCTEKLHCLTSYWPFSLLTSTHFCPLHPRAVPWLSFMPPSTHQRHKGKKMKVIITVKKVTVWNILVDDVNPFLELQPVKFQMQQQKEERLGGVFVFMDSTFYKQIIKHCISYLTHIYSQLPRSSKHFLLSYHSGLIPKFYSLCCGPVLLPYQDTQASGKGGSPVLCAMCPDGSGTGIDPVRLI